MFPTMTFWGSVQPTLIWSVNPSHSVEAVKARETACCGTTKHSEDFDPRILESGDFFPQGSKLGMSRRIIIEMNITRALIQVDSCEYDVGDARGFANKRDKGDKVSIL